MFTSSRRVLTLTVVILGLIGGVAVGQSLEPTHRVTDARGETFDVVLPITVDTIPASTSTTTTTTSSTTTTIPATTTTTPTTTTTTLPPTQDLGPLVKGKGYEFAVDDISVSPFNHWWTAPYFFDLPYADGFGWAAGDRCGYRGVYGFLVEDGTLTVFPQFNDQSDLVGGTLYGRFYVARLLSGTEAYIRLNDGFMPEGQRHFDGTEDRNSSVTPEPGFDECDAPSEAYTAYTGPDERPVVVFRDSTGAVAEIRDYRDTVVESNIRFHLIDGDGSDGRVAVTAHDMDNGGLPGVVVYYDALGGGSVSAHLP